MKHVPLLLLLLVGCKPASTVAGDCSCGSADACYNSAAEFASDGPKAESAERLVVLPQCACDFGSMAGCNTLSHFARDYVRDCNGLQVAAKADPAALKALPPAKKKVVASACTIAGFVHRRGVRVPAQNGRSFPADAAAAAHAFGFACQLGEPVACAQHSSVTAPRVALTQTEEPIATAKVAPTAEPAPAPAGTAAPDAPSASMSATKPAANNEALPPIWPPPPSLDARKLASLPRLAKGFEQHDNVAMEILLRLGPEQLPRWYPSLLATPAATAKVRKIMLSKATFENAQDPNYLGADKTTAWIALWRYHRETSAFEGLVKRLPDWDTRCAPRYRSCRPMWVKAHWSIWVTKGLADIGDRRAVSPLVERLKTFSILTRSQMSAKPPFQPQAPLDSRGGRGRTIAIAFTKALHRLTRDAAGPTPPPPLDVEDDINASIKAWQGWWTRASTAEWASEAAWWKTNRARLWPRRPFL